VLSVIPYAAPCNDDQRHQRPPDYYPRDLVVTFILKVIAVPGIFLTDLFPWFLDAGVPG
jgi:hypothetical protein